MPQAAVNAAAVTLPPQSRVKNIYPPDDPGLPVLERSYLLAGNAQILSRLKLHAATSEEYFEGRFTKPLERLAEYISSLPATSSGLFSGEGGLLSASVELSFLSFQASDGRIFTGSETVERRHKLEPRWRYFCFAAALLYPIGRPLSRMTVSDKSGRSWPKHHQGLVDWASADDVDRVYVSWAEVGNDRDGEPIGPSPYTASLLHTIIGPENLTWLEAGSTQLTQALFEVVSGSETSARIARDVISTMWGKVKMREQARMPANYGRLTIGTHLTPYLVGAMRTLVDSGEWKPNQLPFVVDSTGIYLVWPEAGVEIVRQGKADGHDGWPSSPSVMADLLKAANVFDVAKGDDTGLVEVLDGEGNLHQAFKLRNPHAVVEGYDPAEYKKDSPKTLERVLEQDPIAAVEQSAKKNPVKAVKAADVAEAPAMEGQKSPNDGKTDMETGEIIPASQPERAPVGMPPEGVANTQPTRQQAAGFSGTEPGTASEGQPGKEKQVIPTATASLSPPSSHHGQADPRKIKEAPQIKFSDLVPDEVRKDMKSHLSIELLGKVIKTWRDRGENSSTMRMTDNGAAFTYELLSTMMRSVPDWVNDIAEAGLVYTPAATPGLKVQKVAIPEGSPKSRDAIVISSYGCKKLGF